MAIVTMTRVTPRSRVALPTTPRATLGLLHLSQQVRALHLGSWCSHLDPERRRDTRRRPRVLRYRHMDMISRKLSWDNGSRSHDAKIAMKRAMAHLMSEKNPSDTRYVNADNVKSWSDDISGLRPGRNIEDAERDAMDHLFRRSGKASYEYDMWMSPLRNIQNYLSSHHAPKDVSAEDVITATTATPHDTTPSQSPKHRGPRSTTSRRRHLRKGGSPDIGNAIHADTPQSLFTPKYEDLDRFGPQSEATKACVADDAKSYGPSLWNEPDGLPQPTAEESSKNYTDLGNYKPVTWNEPDGLPKKSSEELSKNYDDLEKYKPVTWNEPNGLQPKTTEELSKEYGDLSQYNAVEWNEPEGLPPKSAEELSKQYDDLDKYNAVSWNEPNGLPEPTPEELSKEYDDLNQYKPVEWHEPHGLRELTPEERSKEYEDLNVYSEPFTASNESVEAHAVSQMDTTVKGEALPSKVDVHSEPPKYEDLHKYGPVHWNEPDGLRMPTPEEESKNYKDLHLYGAVQWNEPDGLPRPTSEELSKNYKDLSSYEAGTHSGPEDMPARLHPEEASKNYSDLAKYALYENDGPETERVHPEEASKAYADLDMYRSTSFDAVEKQYPQHPEEASKLYDDLASYHPVYHNEPNGSASAVAGPANDGLRHYDTEVSNHRLRAGHYASNPDSLERLTAKDVRARMAQNLEDQSRQLGLDKDKDQHDSAWDDASTGAQEALRLSKKSAGHTMTGNYVRDFPEDFVRSWSTDKSSSSLLPNDLSSAAASETAMAEESAPKDDLELSSMDESFPLPEARLEPSVDRASPLSSTSRSAPARLVDDPYSKVPQGLETSYAEEHAGKATWPTFVRHHCAEAHPDPSHANTVPAEATMSDGLYKVLAYDRTSQSVSIAEMTSGVLDAQPPVSPSEVMLKLSNPAKFLPHFGPLHSQGYEVISGSGDVLIFRKVRAGSANPASEQTTHSPVNPIDLMGRPVMGNFASPTGFVNYEALADNDTLKPEPPFRSNIDVRKEEPVFSGGKTHDREASSKKSFGRKLAVGGAWAVGVAYAVGVMAEYFSTGGLR